MRRKLKNHWLSSRKLRSSSMTLLEDGENTWLCTHVEFFGFLYFSSLYSREAWQKELALMTNQLYGHLQTIPPYRQEQKAVNSSHLLEDSSDCLQKSRILLIPQLQSSLLRPSRRSRHSKQGCKLSIIHIPQLLAKARLSDGTTYASNKRVNACLVNLFLLLNKTLTVR